jgi:uncharacterized protein YndB with AHSA1/START domain
MNMEHTIAPERISTSRELHFSRVFWAPRQLVFDAWTDPERLARWWGPNEMTNPVCEMDLRVGGAWRIVMRTPDGTEYPMSGTILEIDAPERLVLSMSLHEHPEEWQAALREVLNDEAHEIRLVVTFQEDEDFLGARTTITMRQRFATANERDAYERLGARQGWGQSLDRLEELLTKG